MNLKFGPANGQALLKIGRTQVYASSYIKLVQPQGGKPNEGFYKFNVEFSSLLHGCEQAGMTMPLQDMRVDLSRFLDKVLK